MKPTIIVWHFILYFLLLLAMNIIVLAFVRLWIPEIAIPGISVGMLFQLHPVRSILVVFLSVVMFSFDCDSTSSFLRIERMINNDETA